MAPKTKHVVIVGGGFAGVSAARELAGAKGVAVTLIDRRNYHLFQPLLYQVAMAGLNPSDISVPLRKMFSRSPNITVLMAEVDQLNLRQSQIHFDGKWLEYDYLVLGCGAKHFYFGNSHWEEFAPGLKNIEQATEIRRRVLMAFEMAECEDDPDLQQQYLTFVVVGGGPTGVELAGAIAEMVQYTLVHDFKRADLSLTRVILVESGPRVLATFPQKLSHKTAQSLAELGVDVRTDSRASEISYDGLLISGQKVKARTILWAAGVKPSQLTDQIDSPKDPSGRVLVESDLSLSAFRNVFVIGDQAASRGSDGRPLPGLAPVAIQQGRHVGQLIRDEIGGRARRPFRYRDKGVMATIGRSKAVVKMGPLEISGFIAWLIWVFVHIITLMKFKNRIFVFFQWVWAYFSFGRGARLIVHKTWRFYSGEKIPIDSKK